MKKIIGISLIIALFAGIYIYIKLDKSYELYKEAKELYENGNVYQAYKKAEDAVRINNYNKKALLFKAKLYTIVSSNEKYKAAENLYKESKKALFEEDYERAKLLISNAYEQILSIPENAPIKDEAIKLQKLIEQEIENIKKTAPKKYYDKALSLTAQNDYIAAFELLNKLNSDDPKIIRLKSDIAFKIGTDRYTSILKQNNPSEIEVLDAIYWLNNVDKNSPNYDIAQKYIKVLKNYIGG